MGNSSSNLLGDALGASKGREYTFFRLADSYTDLGALQHDLRRAGLESSNLIIGVDFTKSNEWTGARSFGGRSLHASDAGGQLNQYEQVLAIISKCLAPFDDDGLIPAYSFGDSRARDHALVSFKQSDQPCNGFQELLSRYRELARTTALAGPTSFAPLIRHACEIVRRTGQYHILVIIADGQVTRGQDVPAGEHSPSEQETIDAIVDASSLPLSIVMVGVGDGPFDTMRAFDDGLPTRAFDNFQFVSFCEVMNRACMRARASGASALATMEADFALAALMEIPGQYRAIGALGLLGPDSIRRARLRRPDPSVLDPIPTTSQALTPAAPAYVGSNGSVYPQQQGVAPPVGSNSSMYPSQGVGVAPSGYYTPYAGGGGAMYPLQGGTAAVPSGYYTPATLAPPSSGYAPGPAPLPYVHDQNFAQPAFAMPQHQQLAAGFVPQQQIQLVSGIQGGQQPFGAASFNAAAAAADIDIDTWTCSACTYINNAANLRCVMCSQTPRPLSAAPATAAAAAIVQPPAVAVQPRPESCDAADAQLRRRLDDLVESQSCPICLSAPKDTVLQCGHQACGTCAASLRTCHICRTPVSQRIRLYG